MGRELWGIKVEFVISHCSGRSSQCNENQNRNEVYDLCLLEKKKKKKITIFRKYPLKKPMRISQKNIGIDEFSKVIKYEINIKKSVVFFCNSNNQLENIMGKDCIWKTLKNIKQLHINYKTMKCVGLT